MSAAPPAASRAEAERRLAAFLPRAGRPYAERRGDDLGPGAERTVSALSPHMRYRLLTEREVIAAALDRHGRDAERFATEVLWRTYFKGWLELRPAAWARFLAERDAGRDAAARSGGLARALRDAEDGRTGIEGFDDWARELAEHGYLHNHARMWFASIWVFTLRLPWALGADLFLRRLVDADPASNTLSWRWVAGLHTPGKTYLATADNIARHTGGRFSPRGLAAEARALAEAPLPRAGALPEPGPAPAGRALLLLHPEDFGPFDWVPAGAEVAGALAAGAADGWPWGEAARRFVEAAAADAAGRAAARFGCPASALGGMEPGAVAEAARAAGATTVLAPHAPVGPVADALAALEAPLLAAGLRLARVRRAWDGALWPLATRGFFPFRERAAAELAAEGLRL